MIYFCRSHPKKYQNIPKLRGQTPNGQILKASTINLIAPTLFNPLCFSKVAVSCHKVPPKNFSLFLQFFFLQSFTERTSVLYYWFPQQKSLINGTLLSKIICIVTLTHQYFHFWSPASRLFASVSPLCDWAICQKKKALIHYFTVHVWLFGFFLLSKLKLRHKITQQNSLGLS